MKTKKLLEKAGYKEPTIRSFTNGNRMFLNDRQVKAIELAIRHRKLKELLSISKNAISKKDDTKKGTHNARQSS